MTLIADSGSTKTTWMEVESGNKVVTEGLNPHFTTDDQFLAVCSAVRQEFSIFNYQFSIYFYGAGCGLPTQCQRVDSLLSKAFGISDVHVDTDMLGACRAVCGDKPGLVGILGTGSNACYYDGKEIVNQAVSTGYILGDEGSANHVGRQLLRDYLSGCMPEGVSDMFHETYPQTKEEFLEAVYHQPNANRFLASLAQFVVEHQDDDYCSLLIEASLEDWYIYQLEDLWLQSGCDDLYLVGGFAAHIDKTLLDNFAEDHELVIKNVVADPIDGLRRYHGLNETPAAYIP
jgi:N-acetylglucosamine kinase-like BadF-type ATPase